MGFSAHHDRKGIETAPIHIGFSQAVDSATECLSAVSELGASAAKSSSRSVPI